MTCSGIDADQHRRPVRLQPIRSNCALFFLACLLHTAVPAAFSQQPDDSAVEETETSSTKRLPQADEPVNQTAQWKAQFVAQLADVIDLYDEWGIDRTINMYPRVRESAEEDLVAETSWESLDPQHVIREQFLRQRDCFRAECMEPKFQRRVFAYDGSVGRIRDTHRIQNGPFPRIMGAYEDSFAPLLPHNMFIDYFFAPDLGWIFGTRGTPSLVEESDVRIKFKIEPSETLGHPCWKLTWRAISEENGSLMTRCEAHFARDRNLLPVSQTYLTPISIGSVESRDIVANEFFKDKHTGLWFPKRVTASTRYGNMLEVSKVHFEANDDFKQSRLFDEVGTISKKHEQPPKPIVRTYAPAPVLSTLPAPTSRELDKSRQTRIRFALIGTLVAVGLSLLIGAALQFTRLGGVIRESLRNHPLLLGGTGILLTLGIGILATWLPGWRTFGLAMMLSGIFGLGWIAFSMLLIGDKTVSIRMALAAAACVALFFGGYQQGIKRMQVRQKMIREIRSGGGQITMGQWRLDEPGLFLPHQLKLLLGEAWSGRANRAAVEQESFTESNVNRWCLDEVRWLAVGSQLDEPYVVSVDAIAKLKDSETLWTLQFEGGHLNGAALKELTRFSKLIDLHFHCHQKPVDPELAELGSVERLTLTEAVMDDQLIDLLAQMPSLEMVRLIRPVFKGIREPHRDFSLEDVEVRFCTVTPNALNNLGQLPTRLTFRDCNFKLPSGSRVELPSTQAMLVQECQLDDQSLMYLTESPSLTHVELADTGVSIAGVESFSERRPGVSMVLSVQ